MVKTNFLGLGGALWLDLVNTEMMSAGQRVDLLPATRDFLIWLIMSDTVPEEVAIRAETWPAHQIEELMARARRLRATLRELCETFEQKGEVSSSIILILNEFLKAPAPGLQLVLGSTCGTLSEAEWEEMQQISSSGPQLKQMIETEWSEATPRQLLFPIAHSAAKAIAEGHLKRLRRCANPNCILWFLDTSKNGKRRWCSMETCGNRHKVSEHHRRKKS